jgi:hypothetical protein
LEREIELLRINANHVRTASPASVTVNVSIVTLGALPIGFTIGTVELQRIPTVAIALSLQVRRALEDSVEATRSDGKKTVDIRCFRDMDRKSTNCAAKWLGACRRTICVGENLFL